MSSPDWWRCKMANPNKEEEEEKCQPVCPPMPQFDTSKCKPLYINKDVKITFKNYPPPEGVEILPIRYGGRYGIPFPGEPDGSDSDEALNSGAIGEEDCECDYEIVGGEEGDEACSEECEELCECDEEVPECEGNNNEESSCGCDQ